MADNNKRTMGTSPEEDNHAEKRVKIDLISAASVETSPTLIDAAVSANTTSKAKSHSTAATVNARNAGAGDLNNGLERVLASSSDSGEENRAPGVADGLRGSGESSTRVFTSSPSKVITDDDDSADFFESDGDEGGDESSPIKAGDKGTLRKKNAPVAKRGSKFLWKDNEQYLALDKAPFKVGVKRPDLLKMTLKDITGKETTWVKEDAENPEWSDANWIKRANSWWAQLIARKLNRPNPATSTARKTRPAWSEFEVSNIVRLCEREIKAKNVSKLTRADIDRLVVEHNNRFEGAEFGIGGKLVVADDGKEYKRARKTMITKSVIFTARTSGGVISMMKRFPNTNLFLQEGPVSVPSSPVGPKVKEKKRPAVVDRRTVKGKGKEKETEEAEADEEDEQDE